MGFGRTNWPRARRIFSVAEMPPVRALGRKLFPEPNDPCCSLQPLPPELESLPGTIQDAVMKGLQIALRDMPPLNVSRSPNETPPFRHDSLNETIALISGGQDTSFQVDAIRDGLRGNYSTQLTGAVYPIVRTFGFNNVTPQELVPFMTIAASDYERIHVSGIDAVPSSLDAYLALAFTVMMDGVTILDRASLLALKELSIDGPPRSRITFYVANRDAQSAFLVYWTVKGWAYMCEGQGNFLSQTLLRQDGQWEEPNAPCIPPRRYSANGACP